VEQVVGALVVFCLVAFFVYRALKPSEKKSPFRSRGGSKQSEEK
jgi:hypothetical protein